MKIKCFLGICNLENQELTQKGRECSVFKQGIQLPARAGIYKCKLCDKEYGHIFYGNNKYGGKVSVDFVNSTLAKSEYTK